MEVAIISPPKMLELSDLTEPSFGMVLPQGIVLSPDYIRFYRDMAGYKILDNGIVEGKQYTGVELHHMAYEVGANCIVVPDKLCDVDATIKMAKDFEHSRNPDLDYMGVLQGKDMDEVFNCLMFFNQQEWITHIGLPRILCDYGEMYRVAVVKFIKREQGLGQLRPFGVHALGASPLLHEVYSLQMVNCDSMDTSFPVVMGIDGQRLSEDYVPRQTDFMDTDIDRNSSRWNILVNNCRTYLRYAGAQLKDDL